MLALGAIASKTVHRRTTTGDQVDSRSLPRVRHRVLLPLAVLALLVLPGVATAQEASGAEDTTTAEVSGDPALALEVTPVIGDGPDDGRQHESGLLMLDDVDRHGEQIE